MSLRGSVARSEADAGGDRLKRQVLLIDDDVAFTRLVKDLLEESGGYEVRRLHDSSEAENRAKEVKPDVVVADIIMAPRDGAEVLLAFKNDPELSQIPFIIMSAFLNRRVFPNSPIDFGEHNVLEKPMNLADLELLVEKIEEELERQQKESSSL